MTNHNVCKICNKENCNNVDCVLASMNENKSKIYTFLNDLVMEKNNVSLRDFHMNLACRKEIDIDDVINKICDTIDELKKLN